MSPDQCSIIDQPLPAALNFNALKSQGISYLQSIAGHAWSNYNESDPGVTILDQLCYALTELGYCAQFSIADVLTRADKKINYRDQFFNAQDILTCAPVTINDYRKLVIDQILEVNNLYIELEQTSTGRLTGRYSSYINAVNGLSELELQGVVNRVMKLLNKYRSIGEVFIPPKILQNKVIVLDGKILLQPSATSRTVYDQIINALNNYVNPLVTQAGYQQLQDSNLSSDEIFNGPRLERGWICDQDALGEKRNNIRLMDLSTLIVNLDGVSGIGALSFSHVNDGLEITLEATEIASIQLSVDFQLIQNSMPVQAPSEQQNNHYLQMLKVNHAASSVEAAVDLNPVLPTGIYRDLASYYSIQNTFPGIYAIGPNSLQSDAPSYRVAQSRQLKGYLMVYDQLLANQFSQLAHIGDLFSFNPTWQKDEQWLVADPSITYQKFITTYYFQPLYDLPDVKPLLRGNNTFHYQFDSEQTNHAVELEAWKKFRLYPFNQYILGLRQGMESPQEADQRREQMLTHLLARHGEDATQYDDMIELCHWYDSDIRTRIIVKSIWLQNFQLLSYYRTCAYSFSEARLLGNPGRFCMTHQDYIDLTNILPQSPYLSKLRIFIGQGYPAKINLLKKMFDELSSDTINKQELLKLLKQVPVTDCNQVLQQMREQQTYPPRIDGQLDQACIYANAKLHERDFDNFSAFELKLGILLGLQQHLLTLASKLQALLAEATFCDWLQQPIQRELKYTLANSDTFILRSANKDQLYDSGQCLLDIEWPVSSTQSTASEPQIVLQPTVADYQAYIDQLTWLAEHRKGFLLIEHILLLSSDHKNNSATNDALADAYYLIASLVFPAYVTLLQNASFQNFIKILLVSHWPAHIGMNYVAATHSQLKKIIPAFVAWHNCLTRPDALNTIGKKKSTRALVQSLKLPLESQS